MRAADRTAGNLGLPRCSHSAHTGRRAVNHRSTGKGPGLTETDWTGGVPTGKIGYVTGACPLFLFAGAANSNQWKGDLT